MKAKNNIHDLPESERPYELCKKYGAEKLTDAQLLAAILRTGSNEKNSIELASDILKLDPINKNLLGLKNLTIEELTSVNGIGPVKAIQILCIVELSKRLSKNCDEKKLKMNSPGEIANFFMEDLRHLQQEQMNLLIFDTKHNLKKNITISKGTVNASLITPREILIEAIHNRAVFIILIHNHPSGDPTPSEEDILFTRRITNSCNMVGIGLSDHIIIGNKCYYSLKEKGIL